MVMKYILFALFLFFVSCACDNPKGCPAVLDLGNTPNGRQLVRDGRDDNTTQMAKLPSPPSQPVDTLKSVEVNLPKTEEPIAIDDGLDYSKIK